MRSKLWACAVSMILSLHSGYACPGGETAEFSFGERQIEQLLSDRREMRGILDPQDPIWKWVAERFETGAGGDRVFWDHRPPVGDAPAEHVRRYHDFPAMIRITADGGTSGVDKWVMLVFEFFNLENERSFNALKLEAANDRIGRDAYIQEYVTLEYTAKIKTSEFFAKHRISLTPTQGYQDHPHYNAAAFRTAMPLAEFLASLDRNAPAREHAGSAYDLIIEVRERNKRYWELRK